MTKVKLYKPMEKDLLRGGTKESRKNILGYCKVEELPQVLEQIKSRLDRLQIPYNIEDKNTRFRNEIRIEFVEGTIKNKVRELAGKEIELGVFIEDCKISNEHEMVLGDDLKKTKRKLFVIYFTVKKKALTYFRNNLLENIFQIVEE